MDSEKPPVYGAGVGDAAAAGDVRPRPRKARGQDRPAYLRGTDIDRVFIMMMELMAEVSTLRDRLDTHEALAEGGKVATAAAVEAFDLDEARQTARDARRDAMLSRVLRVILEERDAHGAG